MEEVQGGWFVLSAAIDGVRVEFHWAKNTLKAKKVRCWLDLLGTTQVSEGGAGRRVARPSWSRAHNGSWRLGKGPPCPGVLSTSGSKLSSNLEFTVSIMLIRRLRGFRYDRARSDGGPPMGYELRQSQLTASPNHQVRTILKPLCSLRHVIQER